MRIASAGCFANDGNGASWWLDYLFSGYGSKIPGYPKNIKKTPLVKGQIFSKPAVFVGVAFFVDHSQVTGPLYPKSPFPQESFGYSSRDDMG